MSSLTTIKPFQLTLSEQEVLNCVSVKQETVLKRCLGVAGIVAFVMTVVIAVLRTDGIENFGGSLVAGCALGCIAAIFAFVILSNKISPTERTFDQWAKDFMARVNLFNQRLDAIQLWEVNAELDDRPDVVYASTATARREELAAELRALMRHHAKRFTQDRKGVDLYA
jgi:hypothetical protein